MFPQAGDNNPTPLGPNGMYDELLYHLDLCILAYHLYHQTLIWPMDPFYEEQARKGASRRDNFMAQVRRGAGALGVDGPTAYRGPGIYLDPAKAARPDLDPIITDYSRLNPAVPSFPKITKWEYIQPSKFITDRISSVSMCRNTAGDIELIPIERGLPAGGDKLYGFEGETGIVAPDTAGASSMLGFVLARNWGDNTDHYDVHIAFRGSRSGWAARAFMNAMSSNGNPDWVTDLAWNGAGAADPEINLHGQCCVGFAQSLKTALPALKLCLIDIGNKNGHPPQSITITGHSLGGALAALCASALTIGEAKNELLVDWPWSSLRLITFSAPTVGDETFCNQINRQVFAQRVNLEIDAITTRNKGLTNKLIGHVGAPIVLPPLAGLFQYDASHDYINVRTQLIKYLRAAGVAYDPGRDTTKMEKYACFRDLMNQHMVDLRGECLPDFERHLREYLTVFQTVIEQRSSFRSAPGPDVLAARSRNIEILKGKLAPAPPAFVNSMERVREEWAAVKWDGDDDVNHLLGLCLILSLAANNYPILPFPLEMIGVIDNI